MGNTFEVSIHDHDYVTDSVEVTKRGTIDVTIADRVSVSDKVVVSPAPIVITDISPPRARAFETITITGTGFGPAGRNEVFISGSGATIISESPTQLQVEVPFIFTIVTDFQAPVQCQRIGEDASAGYSALWIKATVAAMAGYTLEGATPDPAETSDDDEPEVAEAKDWERLVTLLDQVHKDNTLTAGDVLARSADGLDGVTLDDRFRLPHPGQMLKVDPSAAGNPGPGLTWAWGTDMVMPFGGSLVANPGAAVKLPANGHQDSTVAGSPANTRSYLTQAAQVNLLWLLIKFSGATDRIDRIRLLRGTGPTVVYDSGAGLALGNNAVHVAVLDVSIASGQFLEVEVTKTGTTDTVKLVGGVRFRL